MTCLCTQCSHSRNYKMISLLARSTAIIRRFNIICATSVPSVVHVGRTAVVERLYKFYWRYVLKWYFTEVVFQWGKDGRMFLRIVYERARTNRMLLSRLRMSMTSCVTNAKAFDCVNFLRVTLWPWPLPFNLEQLAYMAGHVTNPATKFEDPKTIRAGDTSYNGSRWLPLKCVCGHCACAKSRDPWVGGQKQLHFWNARPRFDYSLYNFYWATTTIKGRLLSSRPM